MGHPRESATPTRSVSEGIRGFIGDPRLRVGLVCCELVHTDFEEEPGDPRSLGDQIKTVDTKPVTAGGGVFVQHLKA